MNQKITALKAQKRNPNRINVYLDGEYAFGVARIVAAWLQIGQELDDAKVAELKEQDTREAAFLRALKLINYRPRSESEVQKKLTTLGYSEAVIAETMERLRTGGLIGDDRFAQDWVDNRTSFRPRSRRFMALELRQKGVAEDVIQNALDEAVDEDKLAYQAALRRAHRWAGLDWATFRERLSTYLMRLGFSYGTVSPLVQQVWADLQSEEDNDRTAHPDTDVNEEENE